MHEKKLMHFLQHSSNTFLPTACDGLSVVQGIWARGHESLVLLHDCDVLLRAPEVTEMELPVLALGSCIRRIVRAPLGAIDGGQECPFCHSIRQHRAGQQPDYKEQINVQK